MPDSNVQLTVQIETRGAEKLTTLRRDLEGVGKTGKAAFAGVDRSIRDAFEQQRRFARDLEPLFHNLFSRLLSGARGFRDAFKRLFTELLDFFVSTLSRMVSAWLGGFNLLGTDGASSGGLLAGLLPSRLASRASTAPASTSLRGIGPVPGQIVASGGLLLGGAGITSGNIALGAAGGALAGFSIGGPIGLAVGAGIGAIGGLFGRLNRAARNRRRAGRAEREFNAQLNSIVTEFEFRRLDFDSAEASIRNALAGFGNTASRFGGPGRRAIGRGRDRVADLLEDLERLASIRSSRAALIAGGPVPEFARGGFTGRGGLAVVHPEEFVFNAQATRAAGRDNLERFNRNPASGPGGLTIIQHIYPSPGMDEKALAREIHREFQREARDRGVRVF